MQVNSYLGLWGHVFDASSSKKNGKALTGPASPLHVGGGLADRLQHAAGEWKAEADEVRSRLIQRIGGGDSVLEKIGEEREAASSFMSETFNQLFGSTDDKDKDKDSVATDTAAGISTTDTLSLLDRMQERLGIDEKLDARQLAALAVMQGLALSSLRKHLAANRAITDAGSIKSASSDGTDAATSRLYTPFSNLGIALPESMVSHFEGEWCLRLQNFANAAGYQSVYLGQAPCSSVGTTGAMTKSLPQAQPLLSTTASATTTLAPATAMIHWNSEAAFSLDCGIESPAIDPFGEEIENAEEKGEESFYSGVSAMLHAARTKASSELSAALQAKTMECSLAVSVSGDEIAPQSSHSQSSGGSGTVLHSSQTLPVFNPHRLNAIKIRICNLPVHSLGSTSTGTPDSSLPEATPSAASINLHGLQVNNRHLAVDSLQGHPSDECHVALVRLPSRALADGFVFNGYMTLEKGNTAGNTALYNVGEMASVEMQIGSLRLLSSSVDGASGEFGILPPPPPPPPPL